MEYRFRMIDPCWIILYLIINLGKAILSRDRMDIRKMDMRRLFRKYIMLLEIRVDNFKPKRLNYLGLMFYDIYFRFLYI